MKYEKRIKAYNKKFVRQLEEALRVIEPFLIKAFTVFYGEEYYSQIENTIKNINYTYFLSESLFKLLEKKSYGISQKDQRVVQYYIKYLKSLGFKCKGVSDIDKLELESLQSFVIKSPFDEESLRYSNFLELLSCDCPVYSIISDEEEQNFYKSILLPIFIIDLEVIIHEINHALMIDAVATTSEEIVMPNLFLVEECEELFNDYIANLVLEQYILLKAPVPYALRKFEFVNTYENFFYLIESFYYVFEKVIKRSIMTKNFNLLWEYAGKEDFDLFCILVQKYYLQGCTEEEYNDLCELVLKMNEHALSISSINYEDYFKELESMGYRVRRLR